MTPTLLMDPEAPPAAPAIPAERGAETASLPDTENPSSPGNARARVLGRRIDDPQGKWLVVVAGIHGNEPAGVAAAERVYAALDASKERLAGAFVTFAGNLGALQAKKRYLDRDLNRAWSEQNLTR